MAQSSRSLAAGARSLLLFAAGLIITAAPVGAQGAGEVLVDVRVHGNHTMPDEDILRAAGLVVGQGLEPRAIEEARARLKATGRFDEVEIRKRYRSLTESGEVVLILLVRERPAYEETPAVVRPIRRAIGNGMFLPILNYTDGYGFTYGARVTFAETLGRDGRVSVPLTWGGTKRAAVELERTLRRGPFDRVFGGVSIWQRENPHYRLDDTRRDVWVGATKQIVKGLRAGWHARAGRVEFGALSDRVVIGGADLTVDTRIDPGFPRNAVLLKAGWEVVDPTSRAISSQGPQSPQSPVNRYALEARGYLGVGGQRVLALGWEYERADGALPAYERVLLGGAGNLRGYRAGAFAGDNLMALSTELRVPLSSPLGISRAGLTLFADYGTAYDHGARLRDARFHLGGGGGVFLIASIVRLNLDLAFREGGGARLHLMSGFQF
jgi:hypothetical protein